MEHSPVQTVVARRPLPAATLMLAAGAGGAVERRRRRPLRERERLVYVLDADAETCAMLADTLHGEGFEAVTAGDVEAFNAALARRRPDVALINAAIGPADGLAVMRRARAARSQLPVFMLQDRPLVAPAVAAMKAGATDVLIKPLDPDQLVRLLREALRQPPLRPPEHPSGRGAIALTRREREVLLLIARGHSNREAGAHLGISQRTIEVHRARVMEKFGARNAADLMRIVLGG